MNMLVSVIVPSYNVGLYIDDCIKSIRAQTYTHWETLIVNDGSTDDTAERVAKFTQIDSRIRLITQKNAGVSVARNTGLFAAQGDCVVFFDGDDIWDPEFLAEAVAAKVRSNADMVYCGFNRLYSNGFIRRYRYKYPSGRLLIPPPNEPVRIHICATLIDRELLIKHAITFTEGRVVGQDWEFLAKVLAVATVQSVPRNLMIYRQRPGSSLNANWNWKRHIHGLLGYKQAIQFMATKLKGTSDVNEVLAHHNRKLGYQSLKLLWRMVKIGAREDVCNLMNDKDFSENLSHISKDSLSGFDSFKYKAVMSKNMLLWKTLTLFNNRKHP